MLSHVLRLFLQKSFDLWCSNKRTPLAFTSVTTVKSLQWEKNKTVLTSGRWVVPHVNPAFCRLAQILCPDVRRPWLEAFASKGRQQGCRMRVLTIHWFSSLVHLPESHEQPLIRRPRWSLFHFFLQILFRVCVCVCCVRVSMCVCVGYVTENIILDLKLANLFLHETLYFSYKKQKCVNGSHVDQFCWITCDLPETCFPFFFFTFLCSACSTSCFSVYCCNFSSFWFSSNHSRALWFWSGRKSWKTSCHFFRVLCN